MSGKPFFIAQNCPVVDETKWTVIWIPAKKDIESIVFAVLGREWHMATGRIE
jgi:hypothetical protein